MKSFETLTAFFALSQTIPRTNGFFFAHKKKRYTPPANNNLKSSFSDDFIKNITIPVKDTYEEDEFNKIFQAKQSPIHNQSAILKEFSDKKQALKNIMRSSLVLKMLQKNITNNKELHEEDQWIGCLAPSLEMGINFNDIFCHEKKMAQIQVIRKTAEKSDIYVDIDPLSALTLASDIMRDTDFDSQFLLDKQYINNKHSQTGLILRGTYQGDTLYFLLIPKRYSELELVDISKDPLKLNDKEIS